MDSSVYLDAIKIVIVCILWYICGAGGNILGKMVLTELPYPMTCTMVQLLSAAVYLGPILRLMKVPHTGDVPKRYYFIMILPLALGKFVSSVSSHISIWKVSVSYAHTVKATLPMFTVILSRILLGEKQTMPVYLSLLPIIGGVVIATLTEVTFDMVGLLSALFATLGFSLQTIFSKKCLRETGLNHLRLLWLLSRLAAACFMPLWLLKDVRQMFQDERVIQNDNLLRPIGLLMLDGLFNMLQNVFAFTVLALVAPLSYGVANATKRLVIIGASLMVLGNPVTTQNIVGMFIASLGVLCYNKAKYDQNVERRKTEILPYIKTQVNLVDHFGKGLPRSYSDLGWKQNGFVHPYDDHILLQNHNFLNDSVTLIPLSEHQGREEGNHERQSNGDLAERHSRGPVVFEV